MKRMSAAVYGQRVLSARAFAFAPSGPVAVITRLEGLCAQAAAIKTAPLHKTQKTTGRVRFTASLERDIIGIGEYRAGMTFDSAMRAKVDYNFLTAQDLRRELIRVDHG